MPDTMKQLTLVLASLGVFQALFLSAYLVKLKKGNQLANIFLAIILLGLSIRIGKSIFNHFYLIEPWQRNLGLMGILLVGPSLWFYGQALLDQTKKPNSITYLHYLPAAMFTAFCWLIPNDFDLVSRFSYMMVSLHFLLYLVASIHLQQTILNLQLNTQANQLYRSVLTGLVIIWSFYAAVFMGLLPFYIGGALIYSGLIYALSYLMLNMHHLGSEKYSSSKLSRFDAHKIIEHIHQLFETEQLFLSPKLSLKMVSQKIGVTPRELSQAVNQELQQNFSEFVNAFRIQRAKTLLVDEHYRHQKIATVATDCGFANTTSFNLAFKALVKQTPSQFRTKQLNT